MSFLASAVLALGALAIGVAVGAWRGRVTGYRRGELRSPGFALEQRLAQEREARLEAEARAARYFDVVADIERERDEWNQTFHRAASGARKAQELLFGELHRMSTLLDRVGDLLAEQPERWLEQARRICTARPSAEVEQVIREFREEHDPQRGAPAKIKRAAGQESVSPPPDRSPLIT